MLRPSPFEPVVKPGHVVSFPFEFEVFVGLAETNAGSRCRIANPALDLLVEVAGLRLTMSGQYTLSSLSDAWGITEQVIQMQINLSGARRRLAA